MDIADRDKYYIFKILHFQQLRLEWLINRALPKLPIVK